MIKCWAAAFSPCAGGRSREHLISRSVFDQEKIFVQGFDWCKDRSVEIGLSSLVSKVLCRKHNSLLEATDRGGSSAVKAFERSISTPKQFIDGLLFERWLLKTAINLNFGSQLKIGVGMADSRAGIPSSYLLQVVFGEIQFSHRMGLYVLFPSGSFRFPVGKILFMPIHKHGEIGLFYMHVRGFDMLLSLYPGHAPPPLEQLGNLSVPQYLQKCQPAYRPTSIVTTTNDGPDHEIWMSWPGTRSLPST